MSEAETPVNQEMVDVVDRHLERYLPMLFQPGWTEEEQKDYLRRHFESYLERYQKVTAAYASEKERQKFFRKEKPWKLEFA